MSETAFLSVSEHAQEQLVVLDESVTGGRKTDHSFFSKKFLGLKENRPEPEGRESD